MHSPNLLLDALWPGVFWWHMYLTFYYDSSFADKPKWKLSLNYFLLVSQTQEDTCSTTSCVCVGVCVVRGGESPEVCRWVTSVQLSTPTLSSHHCPTVWAFVCRAIVRGQGRPLLCLGLLCPDKEPVYEPPPCPNNRLTDWLTYSLTDWLHN